MCSNIKSFKGRVICDGQIVEVYKNLHNGLWSIRDPKTKLVLGHSESVYLEKCRTTISQAGLRRAQSQQVRNVHAYISGHIRINTDSNIDIKEDNRIRYNPFKEGLFLLKSGEVVEAAESILFSSYGAYIV